ncbi:hypothetical protein JHK84_052695 [Glycine max]|nr:hypothetical protein JHK85_053517 [Glycine max]KAG5082657.1 hypothetical protein JHK84_052695 [Glycine max]
MASFNGLYVVLAFALNLNSLFVYEKYLIDCASKLRLHCGEQIFFGVFVGNQIVTNLCCLSLLNDIGKASHIDLTKYAVPLPMFNQNQTQILKSSEKVAWPQHIAPTDELWYLWLLQRPTMDIPRTHQDVMKECSTQGQENHCVQGSWKRGSVVPELHRKIIECIREGSTYQEDYEKPYKSHVPKALYGKILNETDG